MKSSFAVVLFGAVISLASSETNNICESNVDLECMRNLFSENGDCSVISDPNESASYDDLNLPVFVQIANMTAFIVDITVSDMNGQPEELFKDEETGNRVMSVNFPAIKLSAPKNVFSISRVGQEPIVFTEFAEATYPVTITAVMPCDGEITVECLKQTQYSGHITSNDANISYGPKMTDSDNPIIQATYMELVTNLPIVVQEVFITKAEFLFLVYLQSYVCDFGVSPVLNEYDYTVLSNINEVDTDDQAKSRPCADSDDLTSCARDYFDSEGSCSVVRESESGSIQRGLFYNHVPIMNLTVRLDETEFIEFDGKLLDMYINEESNNLVMTLFFDRVIEDRRDATAIFNRRGQEPLVIEVPVVAEFNKVKVTATVPMNDGLTTEAIKKAVVTATVAGGGGFDIGSALIESDDPTAVEALEVLSTNVQNVIDEIFITEAYSYFTMFLQRNICDYGIEPTYFPYKVVDPTASRQLLPTNE